ncbi:hypothetical protein P8A24_04875 [Arcanobacterium wilhelmae]|uniref:hypothetical protein n=1 Tax=Arcanobacterium wilhelmae TaxID=1803177 RepID=UPI0024150E04|nr:hypothetical protein [Arcanobacterium wilhelmae]WFN89548.1 hypothetical protein P8A24_04875 [Arcanobacterium wilhelmae]
MPLMNDLPRPGSDLLERLTRLGEVLERVHFPFSVAGAQDTADLVADLEAQLRDYVLPRLQNLDAPLLCVIGGSTGAGKSAIVNSLIGENVVRSSAIRPTTRRPALVHNPADAEAFASVRVLPELARVSGNVAGDSAGELELIASQAVPRGLALLDAPDIDSVVEENRRLAAQLLAAADLWIFVTTAARYGDAIPWAMLDDAASRDIVLGIVLNRVPPGVGAEVRADLVSRLEERGLARAPLFMIAEQELNDGRIDPADVASLRAFLSSIADDEAARSVVVRQTLEGAISALVAQGESVRAGYDAQLATRDALRWDVETAFNAADQQFKENLVDGSLLRGEVLTRWQDVVGAGEWMRKLESGVSALRDRIAGYFKPSAGQSTSHIEDAIDDGLLALLVERTDAAIAQSLRAWETVGVAQPLVDRVKSDLRSRADREAAGAALVHDWRSDVLALVRDQGASKKTTARVLATSVNVVGVALIVVIFASTGGLVGGEIAVAGGTAVVAQKLLEAIFGEDAVRRLAKRAKQMLNERVQQFIAADRGVFDTAVAECGVDVLVAQELAEAFDAARKNRRDR